jgi:hypothetical protein
MDSKAFCEMSKLAGFAERLVIFDSDLPYSCCSQWDPGASGLFQRLVAEICEGKHRVVFHRKSPVAYSVRNYSSPRFFGTYRYIQTSIH